MVLHAFTTQNLLFYLYYFKPRAQIWPQMKLQCVIPLSSKSKLFSLQIVNENTVEQNASLTSWLLILYFSVCEHQWIPKTCWWRETLQSWSRSGPWTWAQRRLWWRLWVEQCKGTCHWRSWAVPYLGWQMMSCFSCLAPAFYLQTTTNQVEQGYNWNNVICTQKAERVLCLKMYIYVSLLWSPCNVFSNHILCFSIVRGLSNVTFYHTLEIYYSVLFSIWQI